MTMVVVSRDVWLVVGWVVMSMKSGVKRGGEGRKLVGLWQDCRITYLEDW